MLVVEAMTGFRKACYEGDSRLNPRPSPCGICGGLNDTVRGSKMLWFSSVRTNPSVFLTPFIHSFIRGAKYAEKY
jgi:hypothetical protein